MILIGEKLNSTIPSVRNALLSRDETAVAALATAQEGAGADYLDINTALCSDGELDAMRWVLDTVQRSTSCGIMLDSPDPDVLAAAAQMLDGRNMILNSITLGSASDRVLDAARELGAGVVCLPVSPDGGIPEDSRARAENACRLAQRCAAHGIAPEKLYIDVLVEAVSSGKHARTALDTVRAIRSELPGVHTICGLSNVSFGLPRRAAVNCAFLAAAMAAGLDSAILDVTSKRLRETLAAARALLGEDEYCMDYIHFCRQEEDR